MRSALTCALCTALCTDLCTLHSALCNLQSAICNNPDHYSLHVHVHARSRKALVAECIRCVCVSWSGEMKTYRKDAQHDVRTRLLCALLRRHAYHHELPGHEQPRVTYGLAARNRDVGDGNNKDRSSDWPDTDDGRRSSLLINRARVQIPSRRVLNVTCVKEVAI
jgi:hypothetical protein